MTQNNENINEHTYKSFAAELDQRDQNQNYTANQATSSGPDIPTKDKLDQLLAERSKPVPELTYTIGGTVEQEGHSQLQQENEKRIEHYQERLGRMKGKPKEAFDLAQLYAEKENERNR